MDITSDIRSPGPKLGSLRLRWQADRWLPGRLIFLSLTRKRSSVFPDLPTMDSIYPGLESDNWFGLFAPTGTSKETVARLHALALEALKAPELREIIAKDGGDVVGSTPEELGSHLRSEVTRYAKVIKAGNIKAE